MNTETLLAQTHPALAQIKQHDLPALQQASDWQSKYRLLMQLGKKLPALPEKMRHNDIQVKGCESRAWLLHYHDTTEDRHFFILDSEARIVKGLMAIMLCMINGMTTDELKLFDLTESFEQLNLRPYLSQSRGNGLTAMLQRVKQYLP